MTPVVQTVFMESQSLIVNGFRKRIELEKKFGTVPSGTFRLEGPLGGTKDPRETTQKQKDNKKNQKITSMIRG